MSSLRERARELQKRSIRDYDPEDDGLVPPDAPSSGDDEKPQFDGREHYEQVGKSTLRKSDQAQLGEKYTGVAVSRAQLVEDAELDPLGPVEEDEDDDPFAARTQSDGGSDVSNGSGVSDTSDLDTGEADQEHESPAHGVDVQDESDSRLDENEEQESASQSDSDMNMDGHDDGDEAMSGASSSTPPPAPHRKSGLATERLAIRELMEGSTARVAANLSTKDDVERGQAVKQQQAAYDRLLDTRIKLQKAVTASNNLSSEKVTKPEAQEAIRKAEAAAISLWSTIDSIRCSLSSPSPTSSHDSKKRKRPLHPPSVTPLTALWRHSEDLESVCLLHRRAILDHWSRATRASAPSSQYRSQSSSEPPLTAVLDNYLSSQASKLVASSTAPPPNSNPDSSPIYFSDDPFYQSLLRDLIASRTNNPLSSISTALPQTTKPQPINSQKNRRNVDTKASKGRKLRYTVHEKLVSFMAPEDRSTWSDAARREFFESLFGGQGLGAADGEMEVHGNGDGLAIGREEGALRLFRS